MQTIRFSALFAALVAVFANLILFTGAGEAAPMKNAGPEQYGSEDPMRVTVVRSVAGDCEPLCPQWISAEGEITAQSPELFRKALAKIGDRKLPIVISSPGGDVEAALAIGEMIRKRGLDVAVGFTHFNDCSPFENCRPPKGQKGIYRGLVVPQQGFCASACPLILAAGTRRFASADHFIGVHQIHRFVAREEDSYGEPNRMVNGKRKTAGRKFFGGEPTVALSTRIDRQLQARLNGYLDKMGVERKLLALFNRAPPTSIYRMKNGDLRATKLVTDFASGTKLAEANRCTTTPPAGNCVAAKP